MDGLKFYVLLNSISVILRRWADDNERLCAMESRLRLKRSPPQAGIEPGTASSAGQRLTPGATGAPNFLEIVIILFTLFSFTYMYLFLLHHLQGPSQTFNMDRLIVSK